MRLARFEIGGAVDCGVVVGDGIVALGEPDMLAIVAGGRDGLARIAAQVAGRSPDHALDAVRLLAPLRPGKYMAIGMNYARHNAEMGRDGPPPRQYWFNKQTTCISGPFDPIDPGVSEAVDYEVELGVVIGAKVKNSSAAEALNFVFGYLVANDVSARDWQKHSPTFTMGKSFDTHGPIGPWIVTADEIPDPQNLALRCLVNGVVRQQSNTDNMIHTVAAQIEYLSTAMTLEPGDLIATGTPEGVGAGMDPPRFLQAGDVVRCEIDGIGAIENRVAAPLTA
ncbi:fumarylacetoacetate hydrolase family protein [Tsuneonella sp. HG222]